MNVGNQTNQVDILNLIKGIIDMGFSEKQAREALSKFNNNLESAVNYLVSNPEDNDPELTRASNFYLVEESLKVVPPSELLFQQDIEMNQAIINSIQDAGLDFVTYEPLNPESCRRKNGVPVGLKNIGNTCYFNSLIQFYFMIPKLVQEILTFSCHPSHKTQELPTEERKKLDFLIKKASITLLENMQKLMSSMIYSNRKFIDPSKVLHALVDDSGNQILVGDQKDVGEFHMILAARIEEGLKTKFQLEEEPEPEEEEEEEEKKKEEGSPMIRKESLNFTGHQLSEDGIISQLFYAKQIEHLKIPSQNNLELRNEVVFGQIILNVEEKDLYSAWDGSYHSTIDDYLIDNITTTAIQEIWPQNFPGVLLFQIQRVKYDTASNNTIKINKHFTFPKKVYTDRFLLKNKKECSEIRNHMLELKTKARLLEKHIELFNNFNQSSIPLSEILENVMVFIEMQKKPEGMEEDGSITPDRQFLPVKNAKSVKKQLKTYKKTVEDAVKNMNDQLSHIYKQIKKLYSSKSLKANKYHLHSLLIHDGYAGSGHYYAFVHDIESDK